MPTSWVKAALHCGFSIEPLLKQAGLEMNLRPTPLEWVSVRAVAHLMRLCVDKAAPRQHFPFVLGEEFAFDNLPAFEIFVTTSPTLRDALRALDWVSQLLPDLKITLSEAGDQATLRVDITHMSDDEQGEVYMVEVVFAALNKFACLLMGEDISARGVYFKHGDASRLHRYEALFRSPVHLGHEFNGLIFDRALLDSALRGALPQIHQQAAVLVSEQVSQNVPKLGFVGTLEQQLKREPDLLRLGLDGLATRMSLHPRTLQRRLHEEGDSFADLQARVRQALADAWLKDPELRIEDISERLGFADRHSFSRAFRRWTGASPSVYRRQASRSSN